MPSRTSLETFVQDLRFGVRSLRRNPGFALIAIMTLALGIGANAAIFSVVDAVLLQPLPWREPDRAVMIWSRDGRDWAMPGVDTIVKGNLDTRYDGGRGLILLHDGGADRSQTVKALPRLIESLRSQGYRFVQVC